MKILVEKLKTDPDYRYAWQANIAMAFQDEYNRHKDGPQQINIHLISNNAADYFLENLCR